MKSGYKNVNGIRMYYEEHGKGDPLVLIHGGGSTIGTSFGRIIPLLEKHVHVIAMELQAHGHTEDRDSDERFEQDADFDQVARSDYKRRQGCGDCGTCNENA